MNELAEMRQELYTSAICTTKTTKNGDYIVSEPYGKGNTKLIRDDDFGVIPNTKKPSLYKSGAEKIVMALGLFQRFHTESAIEEGGDNPFFFYRIRCDLIKVASDGREYVFASAMGSANTREKRNGHAGAYDSANAAIKMAQKRALVGAAIAISGLSSMFTQDIENEEFMAKYDDLVRAGRTNGLTDKQVKMAHTRLTQIGFGTKGRKELLTELFGKDTIKDLTADEFEKLLDWIDEKAKNTEEE